MGGRLRLRGHAAKKVPMTPQTKFRMASHSKLFTATAIMQLREQGKLRLDDPVSKYLPWFPVKPRSADDPPITIEELLTHSSGLPREAGSHWTTFEFPTTRAAARADGRTPGAVLPGGAVEVLEPGVLDCRDGHRSGERPEVGRLRAAAHLPAVGHDRVERRPERRAAWRLATAG